MSSHPFLLTAAGQWALGVVLSPCTIWCLFVLVVLVGIAWGVLSVPSFVVCILQSRGRHVSKSVL